MKNRVKKPLSLLLAVIMIICAVPMIGDGVIAQAVTKSEFDSRLASFKSTQYGNNSTYVNNPSKTGGYQCFGFANELSLWIFGSYPTNSMSCSTINSGWSRTYGGSGVDNLCVGDVVRYYYHSIFITGISGDTIYYAQANVPSGTNKVTYDNSVSRSSLRSRVDSKLTHSGATTKGWVAHFNDNHAGTHTHSYVEHYEAAHPHKKYMKCSCGEWYYTGAEAATYVLEHEAVHPHREYNHCKICGNNYLTGNTGYYDSCASCKNAASNWDFVDYCMPGYYNVKAGSDFEFSGTVKCDIPINWLAVVIYDENDNEIETLNAWPGTNTYNIANLNKDYDFSTLPKGKYKILVHANNGNNDYAYIYYEYFNVGAPVLDAPVASVRTTSSGKAIITWSPVANADNYDVRIFKSNGDSYKNSWSCRGTSYEIDLPDGDYYVWMCSGNSKFYGCYTYGDTVYFSIKNTIPSKPELKNMKAEYKEDSAVKFEWNSTERTTHYNLYLKKLNETTGEYAIYDYEMHYVESGYEKKLPAGKYKIQLQSTNSETWDYTDGNWVDFAVSHTYNSGKITTAATCKSTGVKTYTCTACGTTKTETVAKNPSNHAGGTAVKNAKSATCTAKGYTGDTYCLGCGTVTAKGAEIPATGHTDSNSDGKCDICGITVSEPEKPDTPDTPSGNCNHICHKTGISHFFYLIARIFWKMFKTNKYCSCGAAHY